MGDRFTVVLSDDEREKWDNFAEENGFQSTSDMVRKAVFEYRTTSEGELEIDTESLERTIDELRQEVRDMKRIQQSMEQGMMTHDDIVGATVFALEKMMDFTSEQVGFQPVQAVEDEEEEHNE